MNLSINYLLVAAGVVASFGLIVGIVKYRSARPCRFKGHDKEYVAGRDENIHACCEGVEDHENCRSRCDPKEKCDRGHGTFKVQFFRWVCRRCRYMGQSQRFKPNRNGYLKIENGRLVSDVKRWANFGKKP